MATLFSTAIYSQTKKIESMTTELDLSSCEIVNTAQNPEIDFIVDKVEVSLQTRAEGGKEEKEIYVRGVPVSLL